MRMMKPFAALLLLAGHAVLIAAKPPVRGAELASTQLNCDAISTTQPLDAATLRDLGPAHSLDAAADVLTRHGVKFARSQGVMTLSGVPARLLHDIDTLPQGEPIILPNGEGSAICVLRPSADSI